MKYNHALTVPPSFFTSKGKERRNLGVHLLMGSYLRGGSVPVSLLTQRQARGAIK